MESQSIHDSAPSFDSDCELASSPSSLVPVIDLRRYIIEDYMDLFEIVEDTPEKVKKHLLKSKSSNFKAKRLKFEDPTGLLQIFLPQFFN